MTDWNADRTPAEWAELAEKMRDEAKRCRQSAYESYERCDTDGFLSQWASGQMAAKYDWAAQLADKQGVHEAMALFDAETGEVASTLQKSGQWGLYWVLNDAAAEKLGKRFVNQSKASKGATFKRNMRKHGVTVGLINVRHDPGIGMRAVEGPIFDRIKAGDYEVIDREHEFFWFE